MAHHTVKSGYTALTERLNRFPQGAPPTELLFKILRTLFEEREAELVSLLPIRPFSAEKAASLWKMSVSDARSTLNALADKALLLDIENENGTQYLLPPPMAGFFEFSLMRIRDDVDLKALGELFYQYLNVEEDFIKALFAGGETQLGRVFVNEEALPPDNSLEVLDYERASEVVKTATHRGIGVCYCRHKMEHVGRACAAPKDICMTFNAAAGSLIRHGFAREVDTTECLDLLQQARDLNLVQFGENQQQQVNFICNCCGCCCEAMIAARRFGMLHPIRTNFLPEVTTDTCTGCGKCVQACPVEAMSLVSANDPHQPKRKKALVREEMCLGCGVCVRVCPQKSISLTSRPDRIITPIDSAHRVVVMALERGTLQHLIFDTHALASHRAMAAILGVILRLPPLKQALASKQLKSRYLGTLISRSLGIKMQNVTK